MGKIVVGVTGEICAGKDTLIEHAKKSLKNLEIKSEVLRSSDVLRRTFLLWGVNPERLDFHNLTIFIRKHYGNDFFAQVIRKKIDTINVEVILWSGLRSEYDLKLLRETPNNILVYVNVDIKERYRRLLQRDVNKGDKTKTFEKFVEDCKSSTEIYIHSLKKEAGIVIDNPDGHLEDSKQLFMDAVISTLNRQE